ncbi:hypothetical protein XU18_4358 [Perkinsela sp. CCAP 1560/4]|nr:hypothetical protein XU18_4358 [Perkinsela sp. CCAP 1560/4]|eukprot:KNH04391.1 hypothetical protein XU18_4358 [Perkinsela sp. CCAP 1560/4]
MQTVGNGYLVLKNLLNFKDLRSDSIMGEDFKVHDKVLKDHFSCEWKFRPEITVDHYLLTKHKEASLLHSFLPQQALPSRSAIVNLLKKKKKKKALEVQGSLLHMAKEVTKQLTQNSSNSDIIERQYAEILRDRVSHGTMNIWMHHPESILAVYRLLLQQIIKYAKVKFPPRLRLAGDHLIHKAKFCQAERYDCCVSQFPCYRPWEALMDGLQGQEGSCDISSWPSVVVWIFYTSMSPKQGGIHFLRESHRKICSEGQKKSLDFATATSHPFLPMRGHIGMNVDRFGLTELDVDSYMSFDEGTVVLMHPATAYSTSVNMTTAPVSSQQIYLMRDGSCGPCSPHTDGSWFGRWVGDRESTVLDDAKLFPLITTSE